MKKFPLIILLMWFADAFPQQIIWDTCNGMSGINYMEEDGNGSLYTFTSSDSAAPYSITGKITKFDPGIHYIWKAEGDPNEQFIKYIDNDGCYFSILRINISAFLLRKYDGNKNKIWETDTIIGYFTPTQIRKLANGYLFCYGGRNRSMLICTDLNGLVKWQKDFDINSLYPVGLFGITSYAIDILQNSDNSMLAVENFYQWGDGSPDHYITLKRLIDSTGSSTVEDTSFYYPTFPSNFAVDGFAQYYTYKQNNTGYYPEFYSTQYYNHEIVVFKVTDSQMNVVNVDTIPYYFPIQQENAIGKISDSSYYLLANLMNSHFDTVYGFNNGQIRFTLYNIKGEARWNYVTPFFLNMASYRSLVHQLSDKTFLIELNDPVTNKIYRLMLDDFQLKWSTVSDDSIAGKYFFLHNSINCYRQYNISNNPSSDFNNGRDSFFFTFQAFTGQDDTGFTQQISAICKISLADGSSEYYMRVDSFGLPMSYYPYMSMHYFETYYAVNFFKILPDHKLFLSAYTDFKCTPATSYLAILGQLTTFIPHMQSQPYNFSLYPNPNHGEFIIHYENRNNSAVKIQITDLMGKIVYANSAVSTNSEIPVQQCLSKGMYVVTVSDTTGIYSRPVIIQ